MKMATKILLAVVMVVIAVQGVPLSNEQEGREMLLRTLEHLVQERGHQDEKENAEFDELENMKERESSFDGKLKDLEGRVEDLDVKLNLVERVFEKIATKMAERKFEARTNDEEVREHASENVADRKTESKPHNGGLQGLDNALKRDIQNLQQTKQILMEMVKRNYGNPPE